MTNDIETVPNQPWTDLDRILEASRRQFFDALGFSFVPDGTAEDRAGFPLRAARTDVEETAGAYRLTLEVPGIPKENLAITVRANEVEIRGERSSSSESTEEPNYLRRERSYAGFYRALELPEPVLAEKAVARVENGILSLELPKEHPEPVPTEVKVPVR